MEIETFILSSDEYLNVMILLEINLFFNFKTSAPPTNAQFYNPCILSIT
jgi:hypothetical protein